MFNFTRSEDARLFQLQLAALLDEGVPLEEATRRIGAKADPALSARLRAAMDGVTLSDGLVREGLLPADLGTLEGAAFVARVEEEGRAAILNASVKRHLGRVAWYFGMMGVLSAIIFTYFQFRVAPQFTEMEGYYQTGGNSLRYAFLYTLTLGAFSALVAYVAIVVAVMRAIPLDEVTRWRRYRWLWKVPGLAGLFRKQISWRVLSRLRAQLDTGRPLHDAITEAFRPFGLSPGTESLFPASPLLDPGSRRAVNLGASLGTLQRQLPLELATLEADLPFAAQSAARVIFYAGYLVLGSMVGMMLVQMYEPIFSMAASVW